MSLWKLLRKLTGRRDSVRLALKETVPSIRLPPHPANVPGPFYVEDGCCMACGVWEQVASGLLDWLPDNHCYVARQPETDAEFKGMMAAMDYAEVDCIRVHNCKPEWASQLREAGLGGLIDPPEGPAAR